MPGIYACNQDLENLCLKLEKKGSVLALLQGLRMLYTGLLNVFFNFLFAFKDATGYQPFLSPKAASFLSH